MLEDLREKVSKANHELLRSGLVKLTWGSISAIDRRLKLVVITPHSQGSVPVDPSQLIIVDMRGRVSQGGRDPSSDALAHLELYKNFPEIGGVVHAHSAYATMFAQAGRELPVYGSMHTDYFADPIPLTVRPVANAEGKDAASVGAAIVSRVPRERVLRTPGILVQGDGPFAWGHTPMEAVQHAKALEAIAETAFGTAVLNAR
jgi:L-ribulose-5-phosphate 4-epimerase